VRISSRTAFLLWLIVAMLTYMSINSGMELIEEISSTVPRSRTVDSLQAVIDSLRIAQRDTLAFSANVIYVPPDSLVFQIDPTVRFVRFVQAAAVEDSVLFHIGYWNTDSAWVQRDVRKK